MTALLLVLILGFEPDPGLFASDPFVQAAALRRQTSPWAWRRRGFVEKWAVIGRGGYGDPAASAALELLATVGDARACAFLQGELDGPRRDQAVYAMERAGVDDDCSWLEAR